MMALDQFDNDYDIDIKVGSYEVEDDQAVDFHVTPHDLLLLAKLTSPQAPTYWNDIIPDKFIPLSLNFARDEDKDRDLDPPTQRYKGPVKEASEAKKERLRRNRDVRVLKGAPQFEFCSGFSGGLVNPRPISARFARWLLFRFSRRDTIVLDFFSGGSFMREALFHGRQVYCIPVSEVEKSFLEVYPVTLTSMVSEEHPLSRYVESWKTSSKAPADFSDAESSPLPLAAGDQAEQPQATEAPEAPQEENEVPEFGSDELDNLVPSGGEPLRFTWGEEGETNEDQEDGDPPPNQTEALVNQDVEEGESDEEGKEKVNQDVEEGESEEEGKEEEEEEEGDGDGNQEEEDEEKGDDEDPPAQEPTGDADDNEEEEVFKSAEQLEEGEVPFEGEVATPPEGERKQYNLLAQELLNLEKVQLNKYNIELSEEPMRDALSSSDTSAGKLLLAE
ncbi:hypothetical protein R1sor_008243 [Riccia sorocarpa]|uniref:Uncharacterized protein n=1 Tax=Riccia sorocarpa TaxID=122646 RepID=A0ABD3HST1_9MARC